VGVQESDDTRVALNQQVIIHFLCGKGDANHHLGTSFFAEGVLNQGCKYHMKIRVAVTQLV
jgi:hypothetical protein